MADKTFKEKYVDQKFDLVFAWTLMTEFIATIIFIFAIMNLVVFPFPSAYAAFLIASIALCVIFAFGARCGAPFNPAIVTGLVCGGKMNIIKGLCYIIVEFLGGLVAGGFFMVIYPKLRNGASPGTLLVVKPGNGVSDLSAIFMEMIATFILVFIVFRIAAGVEEPRHKADETAEESQSVNMQKRYVWLKKMLAPVVIGFTLGFLALPSAYISGGAYNPARVLGGCVVGLNCSQIWIYFIGEFVGGALAGLFHFWVYELDYPKGEEPEDPYLAGEPAAQPAANQA